MTLRVWLKLKAQDRLEEKKEGQANLLGGLRVDKEHGRLYISLGDPFEPGFRMPIIDGTLIAEFTLKDSYNVGFRPDGLYRLGNAAARVETARSVGHQHGELHLEQRIQLHARSLRALRKCYTQIREGKLEPTSKWGEYDPKLFVSEGEPFPLM